MYKEQKDLVQGYIPGAKINNKQFYISFETNEYIEDYNKALCLDKIEATVTAMKKSSDYRMNNKEKIILPNISTINGLNQIKDVHKVHNTFM